MTQFEKVISLFKSEVELSIKDVSEITGILEPNIRRILGQGTITGVLKRICKGVYSLKNGDTEIGFINGDALQIVKHLDCKFDLVFLDIPYKTVAVTGGNRGVKYDLISNEQFNTLLIDIKNCVKEDSYIVHCFSNAPSGWKQMQQYNDKITDNGFKLISKNTWSKIDKSGKPCTNMRGAVMPPEGINIYSLSGKKVDYSYNFIAHKTRVASQKPYKIIGDILGYFTKVGDWILDPFAGSGIVGRVAYDMQRNSVLIEKSLDRFNKELLEFN